MPSAGTSRAPVTEQTSIQPDPALDPAGRARDGAADASRKARQAIQDVHEQFRETHPGRAPQRAAAQGITHHSAVWCGYCKQARSWLAVHGVASTDVDIDAPPEPAKRRRPGDPAPPTNRQAPLPARRAFGSFIPHPVSIHTRIWSLRGVAVHVHFFLLRGASAKRC